MYMPSAPLIVVKFGDDSGSHKSRYMQLSCSQHIAATMLFVVDTVGITLLAIPAILLRVSSEQSIPYCDARCLH